jgi:hypothetical protein
MSTEYTAEPATQLNIAPEALDLDQITLGAVAADHIDMRDSPEHWPNVIGEPDELRAHDLGLELNLQFVQL